MKRTLFALTILSALTCAPVFAGPPMTMAPPPPSGACGTGWLVGLQGGANISQSVSDRHWDVNRVDIALGMDSNVGGYGGIKSVTSSARATGVLRWKRIGTVTGLDATPMFGPMGTYWQTQTSMPSSIRPRS